MRIKRSAKGITSGLLFILIMVISLTSCSGGNFNNPTPTPIPQLVSSLETTFTVVRGPIVNEVNMQGEIVPTKQDKLFFKESGIIDQVYFGPGDTFKKGDVLASLQLGDLQTQLQQAQIDLSVAQDNLAIQKLQQAYNLQQAQSNVAIAQDQVDLATIDVQNAFGAQLQIAKLNLDIANERLKVAQANLALIEGQVNTNLDQIVQKDLLTVQQLNNEIADRELVAPYDGIVLLLRILPGEKATAFDDTVITVGDPTEIVIQIPFDNQLSTTLDVTSEAYLYFNKDKSNLYPVKYIPEFMPITNNLSGINTSPTGTITLNFLYFSIPENISRELLPVGSKVNLQIILGSKQDALLLPPVAIRGNETFKYVIVIEDNYHRRVEVVQIGIQTTTQWEIIAPGLEEGDKILGPSS
jgi:multidrug efflux pump subunit AcrA (membrane-fusion protein)